MCYNMPASLCHKITLMKKSVIVNTISRFLWIFSSISWMCQKIMNINIRVLLTDDILTQVLVKWIFVLRFWDFLCFFTLKIISIFYQYDIFFFNFMFCFVLQRNNKINHSALKKMKIYHYLSKIFWNPYFFKTSTKSFLSG